MFNLLEAASDDQTAIAACLLTMVGAAILVVASYHLGPAGQKVRNRGQKNPNLAVHTQSQVEDDQSHERAA